MGSGAQYASAKSLQTRMPEVEKRYQDHANPIQNRMTVSLSARTANEKDISKLVQNNKSSIARKRRRIQIHDRTILIFMHIGAHV